MVLLTTTQAAEFLGISKRTLDGMRLSGRGPVYSKVGRLVRYPQAELERWIVQNQRLSTSNSNLTSGFISGGALIKGLYNANQ